jgi:hypothetical protein
MQRHATEHPRPFGTRLDLAIPAEADYETIRFKVL